MRRRSANSILVSLVWLAAAPTLQADEFPRRAITIVVPYAPGGGTDLLTRIVARGLSNRFATPVVVENRPGAGTTVAAVSVAKAPADGHLLLMGTSSTLAINATLYKQLPYDPVRDLSPVSLVCSLPFVLVVNPALPVQGVTDLVRLAKASPGKLNYGSGGAGSANHLFIELFKSMTGADIAHVPYKGSSPALSDAVAGRIQLLMSELAPALAQIRAGRLRALGVSSPERLTAAPDIPTLAEAGVPGYDAVAWQMLIAPGKTPRAVLEKLSVETNAIVRSPEVAQQFVKLGLVPIGRGAPDELAVFVKTEIGRWGRVVQQAGVAGSE